jgi:hypothetical protein
MMPKKRSTQSAVSSYIDRGTQGRFRLRSKVGGIQLRGTLKHISLGLVSLLTLAGCVSSVDSSSSPQVTQQPESEQSDSTRLTGTSGYLPGTYLPEHCDGVEPQATPVFENLISELDAENCIAPYTSVIRMQGAEVVTAESAGPDVFGVSQYLRVYRLLERVPTISSFGQWGQWIGNDAHHSLPFNSIEGGLFVDDKMGRSYYPKYMASAATHGYSGDSDTGGGWGFYERRISCDVLGRVTLSNKMLVPPHLISFDEDQEAFENDGGISVGTAWAALPIIGNEFGAVSPGDSPGLLTWTFVIDSANYSGPLIAYTPQHWNLRMTRWNTLEMLESVFNWAVGDSIADPSGQALVDFFNEEITETEMLVKIQNQSWYKDWWADSNKTHGVSPAEKYVPTGIEMPPVPLFAMEEGGKTFIKSYPPKVPNTFDQEPIAQNIQTFDAKLISAFTETFKSTAKDSSWKKTFKDLGIPMHVERNERTGPLVEFFGLKVMGEDYYDGSTINFNVPLLAATQNGETSIVIDWTSTPKAEREIASYYEVVGEKVIGVTESEVPEALRLLDYGNLKNPTNLQNHFDNIELPADDTFNTDCWVCEDPNGCDKEIHQTTLDDGSVISYRWYRFIDQPVFWNMKREYPDFYTDSYLADLQMTMENMHRNWDGSVNLLERPADQARFHLAEIDHGLILDPPAGKEVGWVPIVTQVEHPDGVWKDEIIQPESDNGPWLRR